MLGQQRPQRDLHLLLGGGDFGKYRRLMQRDAHVETDQHQDGGEDKRHAPAPRHKLLVGQQPGEQQEGTVGKEEADRRAELREGAVERTLAGRGVFGRQQRRAAPLTAKAQALAKARQRQQQGSKDTDGCVARQQADQHGRNPHRQQGCHQRGFTPDAIAKVTKHRRADRTRHKGDGEGRQRL